MCKEDRSQSSVAQASNPELIASDPKVKSKAKSSTPKP